MAVLVEAISVIVKRAAIEQRFPGGVNGFILTVPNSTFCADEQLVRVGFMMPHDVGDFVEELETCGLEFLRDDKASDFVVVDQRHGPTTECDWIEFVRIEWSGGHIMAAFEATSGRRFPVAIPAEWKFKGSLSDKHRRFPREEVHARLEELDCRDGVVRYRDRKTGQIVCSGTTTADNARAEYRQLAAIANRVLELDDFVEQASDRNDRRQVAAARHELRNVLLPTVERLAVETKHQVGFLHYVHGLLLRKLRQPQQAIEHFEKSLLYHPDALHTLLEITCCHIELGDMCGARPHAEHAVEVDPDSPAAWGNLASVNIDLGRGEAARQALEQALALNPYNVINRHIWGRFRSVFGEEITIPPTE